MYIGDVSNNDGIPRFVRPEPGEAVGVLEVRVTSLEGVVLCYLDQWRINGGDGRRWVVLITGK